MATNKKEDYTNGEETMENPIIEGMFHRLGRLVIFGSLAIPTLFYLWFIWFNAGCSPFNC